MDDDKALLFYEKMYFHELESREKLTARLQLSLAMLTGLIAVISYVVSRANVEAHPGAFAGALLLVSIVCGVVLLATAVRDYIRALWGHSYECLPYATDIEAYRVLLGETYKGYTDGESLAHKHYKQFLIRYYSECAARNAAVNERRFNLLHECTSYMVYSLPALVALGLIFALGGFAPAAAP